MSSGRGSSPDCGGKEENMHDFKVDLPDGRIVDIASFGDEEGVPMFAFHGTPTSNAYWAMVDEPARRRGLRVLAPNRPGIRGSDPHPLPLVASYADDVAALANRLDMTRFAIMGHSGGAPFALACGALLPDRVTAVATVAGVGPLDNPEVRGEVPAGDQRVFRLIEEGKEGAAGRMFKMGGAAAKYAPRLVGYFLRRQTPAPQRELFDSVGPMFIKSIAEALEQGPEAGVNEYRIFSKKENWGFEPKDITVPVHIWQGEEDPTTYPIHAKALAKLMPQAKLHLLAGVGHPVMATHFDEIADSLDLPKRS
jgi:pimeloyl-ACP methyl ester carboxylesterase